MPICVGQVLRPRHLHQRADFMDIVRERLLHINRQPGAHGADRPAGRACDPACRRRRRRSGRAPCAAFRASPDRYARRDISSSRDPAGSESTSATQTSFTFGCDAMPSSVEKAMPLAPKLASRSVPEGGFESRSRTKKGAARAAPPVFRRNDRRSVIKGLFYCETQQNANFRLDLYYRILLSSPAAMNFPIAVPQGEEPATGFHPVVVRSQVSTRSKPGNFTALPIRGCG